MQKEIRSDLVDRNEGQEVFAEISLFGAKMAGSDENGDCSCVSCDGSPCFKGGS